MKSYSILLTKVSNGWKQAINAIRSKLTPVGTDHPKKQPVIKDPRGIYHREKGPSIPKMSGKRVILKPKKDRK